MLERRVALPPQGLQHRTEQGRPLGRQVPPAGGLARGDLPHHRSQRADQRLLQTGAQLLVVPGSADEAGRGPLGAVQRAGPGLEQAGEVAGQ
jgi:hypothetical protein